MPFPPRSVVLQALARPEGRVGISLARTAGLRARFRSQLRLADFALRRCAAKSNRLLARNQAAGKRSTLISSAPLNACAKSQAACSRYHVVAPPPNALSSRMAISGEIPAWPFTNLDSRLRLTPSTRAPSAMLSPSGAKQSWRTDKPGCGGFFIVTFTSSPILNGNRPDQRQSHRRLGSETRRASLPKHERPNKRRGHPSTGASGSRASPCRLVRLLRGGEQARVPPWPARLAKCGSGRHHRTGA